jgi:two-component system phosphate regulon sensor histidine kinase PhoR
MPRTRLVWHLFAAWCALAAVLIGCCFWLASVQLADLATAAQRQRLIAAARSVAGTDGDPAAFERQARDVRAATGITLDMVSADAEPTAGTAGQGDAALVAEARAGRIVVASRYDLATDRRFLTVAVPLGSADRPAAIVRATADTRDDDVELARRQRRLLVGCLTAAAAAAAAGWAIARRVSRPMRELAAAAARLAAGDIAATIPSTEIAEVADLSEALGRLREQLVERGLTIGRQGTQQEAVLGSMIEGVLAIDARQRIVGINRAAAELLGIELDDAVRRPLQEVVRNADLRRFALTAIDCREPVEDDIVLRGARDRTIRLRGTALRDLSGEGGAVIVLNDVTDVQRLESVRRDFVANVSHELKTPIASIKGFVETLLDGAVDEPQDARHFLGIVVRQADRLAAIIEDLLALSRIEQSEGAGNLPLEACPVALMLDAAIADCSPRARERSIVLESACPPDLVAEINAPLLEQALINLVDNAVKYSDTGRTVRVVAEAAGPDAGVAIAVHDQGCGIAAEHLPRLFERFYRVDRARSRSLGGTGLGLSIVKHIVQAHGGSVAVESTPGVGSTFTIHLPPPRSG